MGEAAQFEAAGVYACLLPAACREEGAAFFAVGAGDGGYLGDVGGGVGGSAADGAVGDDAAVNPAVFLDFFEPAVRAVDELPEALADEEGFF